MSEIDDFSNSFEKLSCNFRDNLELVSSMTNPTPKRNWDIFKSRLQNIRPYDGNSLGLNKFLSDCEHIINAYQNITDQEFLKHICRCLQSK